MTFHVSDPKTGTDPVDWMSDDGTVSLKGTTIKQTLHGNAQIVSRAGGNHILRLHKYDRINKNRIDGECVVVTQESSGTRSYGSEIWAGGKFVSRKTLDFPSPGSIATANNVLGRQWYTHYFSLHIHGLRPLYTYNYIIIIMVYAVMWC